MSKSYQKQESQQDRNQVQDALEGYVREGARQMLAVVLEEEVNAFLGRHRYARGRQFRGYRNGYHQARELTVGLAAVEVRVPRVSQVPQEVAPQGFHSQVVIPILDKEGMFSDSVGAHGRAPLRNHARLSCGF